MMRPEDKFYIQSINRAFTLVDAVAERGASGIFLRDLVRPNLPMSTAYRIMQNLVAWQYIEEREDGSYILGTELMRLGKLAHEGMDIVKVADRYIRELSAKTGQTVYMARFDDTGEKIYYVAKIKAAGTFQLSGEIGTRNNIHSTANGKALASGLSDKKILEILSAAGMPVNTERTCREPQEYLKEIEWVRQKGYSLDDEENEKNVVCVAAPIQDYTGQVVASVSISGIKNVTLTPGLEMEIDLVKQTARNISERLSADME